MAAGGVKFIRVNGRVVPIKGKDANGPSKAQSKKNYNKYGDGANQASRIDAKYEKKSQKAGAKGGYTALAGAVGGFAMHKLAGNSIVGKLGIAAGATTALLGIISGHRAMSKAKKKNAVSREKEYVKTFGSTSDGQRPQKTKKSTGF